MPKLRLNRLPKEQLSPKPCWYCPLSEVIIRLKNRKVRERFMKYKVNLQETSEGYAVWVPGLPGCWSQGKTEKEALENIKDALKAYLETVEDLSKDNKSSYVEVG
jgi:predicted RNase H-like HicB family nuclease